MQHTIRGRDGTTVTRSQGARLGVPERAAVLRVLTVAEVPSEAPDNGHGCGAR